MAHVRQKLALLARSLVGLVTLALAPFDLGEHVVEAVAELAELVVRDFAHAERVVVSARDVARRLCEGEDRPRDDALEAKRRERRGGDENDTEARDYEQMLDDSRAEWRGGDGKVDYAVVVALIVDRLAEVEMLSDELRCSRADLRYGELIGSTPRRERRARFVEHPDPVNVRNGAEFLQRSKRLVAIVERQSGDALLSGDPRDGARRLHHAAAQCADFVDECRREAEHHGERGRQQDDRRDLPANRLLR